MTAQIGLWTFSPSNMADPGKRDDVRYRADR